MKFEVKNRFSGEVQFTAEIECAQDAATSIKFGLAVKWAYKSGAYLGGADLRDADLGGAYLRGAYLGGAYLRGAYLGGADLRDAYLGGAYLRGADLRGADLGGADLRGADLGDVLKVDPSDIPVVPNIDSAILAAVEAGGIFNMDSWHGESGHWCGTEHCRAGWAIHLAGEKGRDLEKRFGPNIAGTLIYEASRPGKPAPWFFDSTEGAMEDIRKCAQEASNAGG